MSWCSIRFDPRAVRRSPFATQKEVFVENTNVSRRRFSKLTAAAFGGMVAGTAGGLRAAEEEKPKISVDPSLLLKEPNVCRGLNTCKGKGKGNHACAGQGACSSVAAHDCAGMNDCSGKGGCGGYPGQNTCKAKGHCAVRLSKETWALARKQFEQLAKETGLKVGKPPKQ